MTYTAALRWSLLYRGITTAAFLVALALFGVGLVAGFGGTVTLLLSDFPHNVGDAIAGSNPLITLVFAVIGVLVWQVGKSFALFVTLPRATGRRAASSFDTVRLRSEDLEALDERLSEIERDVAETRRAVQELKRDGHAMSFDQRETADGNTAGETDATAPERDNTQP